MPDGTSALLNPTVIGSLGVGGVISVILIVVMYRMLVRIDDSIHAFHDAQHEAAATISKTIADATLESVRMMDRNASKLDMLLDRTGRTFEQVAIHRGVSEPPLTGTSPAILTPANEK